MEDFEAQEIEFWAKLSEESISRSQMLRRSAAAAFGLTVLAAPASALAARTRLGATTPAAPASGMGLSMSELVSEAKKEGVVNTIALPLNWANYGEIITTFQTKYGLKVNNPAAAQEDSSAQENQAIVSLKGSSRAPDVVDDGLSFVIQGGQQGLFTPYKVSTWSTIPANQKDPSGLWTGDYWGAVSIGYNSKLVKTPPTTWKSLLNPEYKGQVYLDGSPLTANAALSAVFAAALGNGGSLSNIGPGIDFFSQLHKIGNYETAISKPIMVASGEAPISIDWDYLNLGYAAQYPAAHWKVVIPTDGVYGGFYAQAVSKTGPNPWAARLWEEFLYSDQGQLLWLKGGTHPIRFQNLVQTKAIPSSLLTALPPAASYAKIQFASIAQQTAGKNLVAAQWPSKIGA
jgi:putative spermidine/putrescine transport system substrate-binding protein